MVTRLKCHRCGKGWRMSTWDDILCPTCGAIGECDVPATERERAFDVNKHKMADKVTG